MWLQKEGPSSPHLQGHSAGCSCLSQPPRAPLTALREETTLGWKSSGQFTCPQQGELNCPERPPFLPSSKGCLDKQLHRSALLPWVFPSVPLDPGESYSRDGGEREVGITTALAQISGLMLAFLAHLVAEAQERKITAREQRCPGCWQLIAFWSSQSGQQIDTSRHEQFVHLFCVNRWINFTS